ncbi:3-oxoacyl-[acyl-carrier-protein] synthase III [Fructilactobacillus fructivorans]|uniref:beta-ketoacyl-ACP synthase III n=1 Tax=Fructilactobacillus fructivorans TaxID=1614 RepID=UPI000705639F|nr:beta-ketoacyl-ACP synthase III [Fructilactobacillus fructivorans]KRN11979.1 3-oxoacyl-[acyl-carrier-protein] synthase III [Fructilactobacillus fructivorans]
MGSFSILETARSTPERIVTNQDLAKVMDTSDEWIKRRTGISERHISQAETNTSMCADVASQLVSKANVSADDIDFIIVATMSSDYQTPSAAAAVQGPLHAKNAIAFDINAACSGFAYGIYVLNSLLSNRPNSKGILIGGEQLSKYIDWSDRSTAVLFGDGAAGILVANDGSRSEVLASNLETVGELGGSLTAGHLADDKHRPYFKMDGHEVYRFATQRVPRSIRSAIADTNIELDDVKYFIVHQANERIIKSIANKLDLPMEKFPVNINKYGNTAAASEPLLLSELVDSKQVKRGDNLVLTGFGGGLTIGTVVIRY